MHVESPTLSEDAVADFLREAHLPIHFEADGQFLHSPKIVCFFSGVELPIFPEKKNHFEKQYL